MARDMFNGVVEVLQVFNPFGLSARDFLWLLEVLEVLMVSMNLNWFLGSKEEWASHLEAKNHGC